MSKTVVYEVQVVFGDCDPAGIVFFPNFSKWMDGLPVPVWGGSEDSGPGVPGS
jgi:acyl-CoA thioesterase FadM